MTYKTAIICRSSSLVLCYMLLLQFASGQARFVRAENWLKENIQELGGRAVLLVCKDGKIVYNKAENELSRKQKMIGNFIARRRGKDPEVMLQDFSSTTKELIASCSKWLSAALVMTFVDEGKLNLNDTIGKYLPVMSANGKGYIKIWHCLSHLTGIKTPSLKDSRELTTRASSMDEAISNIAIMPMEGTPGKTFHYSSAGLQIAASVMEKISGKDFETLFQERIALPCEMKQTDFGKVIVPLAAGGARSTAEDYMNFLEMIQHDGKFRGKKVLSQESVSEMQKNRISQDTKIAFSPEEAGNWGYGFGEWVMDNSPESAKSGVIPGSLRSETVTSPGAFGSFPWVDNKLGYTAFLFTLNFRSKGRNEKYKELKKIVDEAIMAR